MTPDQDTAEVPADVVDVARLILHGSVSSYDETTTERRQMAREAAQRVIAFFADRSRRSPAAQPEGWMLVPRADLVQLANQMTIDHNGDRWFTPVATWARNILTATSPPEGAHLMPEQHDAPDAPEPEWSRYWDKIASASFLTDEEKRAMLLKMGAPFPTRPGDPVAQEKRAP